MGSSIWLLSATCATLALLILEIGSNAWHIRLPLHPLVKVVHALAPTIREVYLAALRLLVGFLGLQLLLALLFDLPQALTLGPLVLLVEDGVEAAGVRFFEVVGLVLVAARNLLRYDLGDFIKMRVHRFVNFLGAFGSLTDGVGPVFVVPILAWWRYGLLSLGNFLRERDFRVVAELAFGAAASSVDVALRPVVMLRRFVFSGAWHLLFLFGMLFEEGQGFDFTSYAFPRPQSGAGRLALRRYVRLDREVGLILVGSHVGQAQGVTWPLDLAVAGATAQFPGSANLVGRLGGQAIEVDFLPIVMRLDQFSLSYR